MKSLALRIGGLALVAGTSFPAGAQGDWDAVANLARGRRRAGPPGPGERLRSPGWGGYLLVGTPEQIVDRLIHLSTMGLDGVVLSWVNYEVELAYWISAVLPVMEQAGLRRPYALAQAR